MKNSQNMIALIWVSILLSCSTNDNVKKASEVNGKRCVPITESNQKVITGDIDSLILENKKKATQGNADAMYFLGIIYDPNQQLLGSQLPKDYSHGASLRWYERAATLGHIEAIKKVASFYEEGIDCTKNPEKAHLWYSQGYQKTPSAFALKMYHLYKKGIGCKQDLKKAKGFLTKASHAASKDSKLAYELGKSYLNGSNGLPIDNILGQKWLKKSNELGYIFAELELELMKENNSKEDADSFLLLLQERNKIRSKKN